MKPPTTLLGGLSPTQFIEEYWQQKPLLIRQAMTDYQCPISAEELAGLAMEDDVESRLIQQLGQHWSCRYGPFAEADFTTLPDSHWTLLVQGCNRYIPEFAALLQRFDFLPAWRLDDIMLSFAADQGSVGPHLDQYDVFLLQGQGTREWRISEGDFSNAKYLNDTELKILSQFNALQTWQLQPGDMLYLPPGVAHYGVAQGPCITISIGFRATNASQMINAFCDELLATRDEALKQIFYRDPIAHLAREPINPGLIDTASRQQFIDIMQPVLLQQLQNDDWMAIAVTQSGTPPAPLDENVDIAFLQAQFDAGAYVLRDQGSRFAYTKSAGHLRLFVNGDVFDAENESEDLIKLLTSRHFLSAAQLRPYTGSKLLIKLLNLGLWGFIDLDEVPHLEN